MSARYLITGAVWVCLLAASVGCSPSSDGPARIPIQGKVSYNGTPIAEGAIAFYPDSQGPGVPTSGPIQNGVYNLSGLSGIAPGTYRVEIQAFKPPAAPQKDAAGIERPAGMVTLEQTLPEKFNTQSTLDKLTVSPAEKELTRDYDLRD